MKNSPLTTILLIVLGASVLASLALCGFYIRYTGRARALQPQAILVNQRLPLVNALANDALEYSKQHSDIDPILIAAGVKAGRLPQAPSSAPPATQKSPGK